MIRGRLQWAEAAIRVRATRLNMFIDERLLVDLKMSELEEEIRAGRLTLEQVRDSAR